MRRVRRAYVDLPEGQIHLHDVAGCDPPIVLLHQTASSARSYEPLMEVVPLPNRLVALDTPGFGGSYDPEGWPSLETYAARILAALDVLGVERFHVYGHHTGASLAIELAAGVPERVVSLMLSGPVLMTRDEREAFAEAYRDPITPQRDGSHLALNWSYSAEHNPSCDAEVLQQAVADLLRAWRGRPQAYMAVARHDTRARARDVRAPTLLLTTRGDFFRASFDRALAMFPGAATAETSGDNFPATIAPGEVAAAIETFVAAVEEPSVLKAERIALALRATDFAADLAALKTCFGDPTFVEQGSWAQFDSGGARVCLAGDGEGVDGAAALLVKVESLEAAGRTLAAAGFRVGRPQGGGHEERLSATAPSGLQVIAYRPRTGPDVPAPEAGTHDTPVAARAPTPADPSRPGDDVTVDPAAFKEVLGHFSTGVVVVTAMDRDTPVGMTAQSVVSLSLEPPLVLFCPARTSSTWPRIRAAGRFAINILAADQQQLCAAFARFGGDKFATVSWEPGHTGSPLLSGALAHVECELERVEDGGDHEIAIGRVIDLGVRRDASPLIFYRGSYASL